MQTIRSSPTYGKNQLVFTNGIDSSFVFNFSESYSTSASIEECYYLFAGGCTCPECERPYSKRIYKCDPPIKKFYETTRRSSWIEFIGDSAIRKDCTYTFIAEQEFSFYLEYVYDKYNNDSVQAYNHFFGFNHFFNYNAINGNINEIGFSDTLLSSFTTPIKNYNDVIFSRREDRVSGINEMYYNSEYGLIAFFDSQSNELFYRSDN